MNRKTFAVGQLFAVASLVLAACAPPAAPRAATSAPAATTAPEPTAAPTVAPATMSVGETAMADNSFTTLVELAIAAGITPTLTGPDPITVFAPTNDAFAKLPAETVAALKADPDMLKAVLTYHVLPGKVTSADITGMGGKGSPTTLNGATVNVTTIDGSVYVNDAKVIKADVESTNGVIHVIDTVLIPPDMMAASTVAATAMANSSFNTLSMLVTLAGLGDALKDPAATLTVFAPTDEAFAKLPQATVDALVADTEALKAVLLYHVVGSVITSEDVAGMGGSGSPATLNGATISVTTQDGSVFVNGAKVVMADIATGNGVIHAIDTVLLPPDMAGATMSPAEAMTSTEMMSDTMAVTGTAVMPDTTAMTGTMAMTGTEMMTETMAMTDTMAMTGTAVMPDTTAMTSTEMMPDTTAMTDTMEMTGTEMMTETMAPDMMSVGETAMADNSFTTLVELAIAAGITPTLTGPDPITVFAPTNDAFAKLPAETVAALKADPDMLKAVLLYHVLVGKVTSADITGMGGKGSPETANGATVNVTTIDGSVYVNDAKVIKADVESTNGVIHVIDTVLIPPDMMAASTVAATAMANSSFNTLSMLVTLAGLGDALKDPAATLTVFAPTDEAFAKVPKATMDALAADPEMLKAVLLYHVLGAKVTSKDVAGMGGSGNPETLNGATISVTTKDKAIFVNGAKIIAADMTTGNGVIHVIDTVLIPPTN